MAYGLSTRAFIEQGPVEQVANLDSRRSTARNWRALCESRRLAAIERALTAANDCGDGFPTAL